MGKISVFTLAVVIIWGCLMTNDSIPVVVKRMNLEDITTSAHYIFSGRCIGFESRYDSETGREAVFVSFSVTQMIRGEDGEEFTFKMSKVAVDIGNAPTFKTGDQMILFLYEKSASGLTSPVGLGQGTFSVFSSSTGERIVVNANNNTGLVQGIDKSQYAKRSRGTSFLAALDQLAAHQSGPINYQTFITLVEGMVNGH